jgi:hypothetical protein
MASVVLSGARFLYGRSIRFFSAVGTSAIFLGTSTFDHSESPLLGATKIRLVRLFTVNSTPVGPQIPSLVMNCYDLSDFPDYFALSYTWGPPQLGDLPKYTDSDLRPIFINSKRFEVFPNLYDALLQLAIVYPGTNFWIDAICIDQRTHHDAITERSHQVSIMNDIYQNASKTIVWIGKETERTAKAAEIIASTADFSTDKTLEIIESKRWGSYVNLADPSALCSYGMRSMSKDDWITLADIFTRNYFGRLWMVQEIALSKQAVVLCGSIEMMWDDIGMLAAFLGVTNAAVGLLQTYPPDPVYYKMSGGLSQAMSLHAARIWCVGDNPRLVSALDTFNWTASTQRQSHGTTLLKLIMSTVTFSGTNYKDKIFAYYGLLKHLMKRDATRPNDASTLERTGFYPNYHLSEADVFLRAATSLIEDTGSLNVITFGGNASRPVAGIPSWVPDFSPVRPLGVIGSHRRGIAQFNASGSPPEEHADFLIDDRILYITGHKLACISDMGNTWTEMLATNILDTVAMLLKINAEYPYVNQSNTEALWRTMIMDQDLCTRPASSDLRTNFKAWISLIILNRVLILQTKSNFTREEAFITYQDVETISRNEEAGMNIFPSREELEISIAKVGGKSHPAVEAEDPEYLGELIRKACLFEAHAIYNMVLRRLFITDVGHIGLGIETIALQDELWVVKGCSTPLILRKLDWAIPTYQVICESYVHGIMQGEGVDKNTEWESICLV